MTGLLKHISPRTKILFFAVFLVLLPGAVLSYLGFRSISEKAENLTATYRGTVNLVREKIEFAISGLEKPLRSSLVELEPPSNSSMEIHALLKRLAVVFPGLGRPFFASSQGGVISTTLSLGWRETERNLEPSDFAMMTDFRLAEQSEYARKNYAEAIRLYANVLGTAKTPAGRNFVLSRIGRCYFKMKRYRAGITEYKKMLAIPDRESGPDLLPSAIVALSQIADGYASLGKSNEREATIISLYKSLLNHPWDLEGGNYAYYLKYTIAEVDSLLQNTPNKTKAEQEVTGLKEREKNLIEECEYVERIHQSLLPQILPEMNRENVEDSAPMRLPLALNGSTIEVNCLRPPASYQRLGISSMCYVLNEGYFVATLLPGVLGTVDLGRDLVVGILDPQGTPRYLQTNVPTSRYLMAEDLSRKYAGWKVALFHPDGQTLAELVGSEEDTYLALFLGIVAVMVIGIVVIGRASLHELEAARMKSEFVSSVSHELKTPLALIRMFGETLESGLVSDEARRREFYRIITQESERLTHLINNVLDFSRVETGNKQYHFEEDDIARVVRSTLEAYRFHIRDLGFEMVTEVPEEPIVMMLDKDAISQALLNLLNNAAKYSDEQKYIRVEVAKVGDWGHCSVEDRGVGIPPEEIKKVFEKFYRTRTARTRETTGSGLGLTLVKHIVEAHGGSVEVTSTVGRGSTFVLRLPLRQAADT